MDNEASHSSNQDVRTLGELIENIPIAMLVSVAPDGNLVSRPLATLQTDFQGDLWFFTSARSGKIDDIADHPRVNLAYADSEARLHVSVVGRARVLDDRSKMQELWQPEAATYFPGGPDDPDLRLLKVEVESAEYWQQSSGLVREALRLMAQVTGSGPQDLAENRELHIRR